jgi:large subunit ribosomal protein L3
MIREIFGKKIGMTQVFDGEGNLIGVSLVEVEPACILEKKEYPNKISAKIGCFKVDEKKLNKIKKPVLGYFKKLQVSAYKLIKEVESVKEAEAKKEVGLEIFNDGDIVHVRGKIKGRGFQGGVKRHGWHGGPGGHGSMFHRRIGSNGANTDPGRVVRGHRMPGHMGDCFRTTRNVRIIKVDREKNLLFIEGSVPGARGAIINIKKVKWPETKKVEGAK